MPLAIAAVVADHAGARTLAFAFVVAAILTDAVDGWVSRATHTESEWGRVLDPVADKLGFFIIASALAATQRIPVWLLLVILGREALVVIAGIVMADRHDVVAGARWTGKLSTVILAAYLVRQMFWPTSHDLAWGLDALGWVAVATLAFSTLDYARRARTHHPDGSNTKAAKARL